MLYTLKRYPLPEYLSIPIQIQSLQAKAIEVIIFLSPTSFMVSCQNGV